MQETNSKKLKPRKTFLLIYWYQQLLKEKYVQHALAAKVVEFILRVVLNYTLNI